VSAQISKKKEIQFRWAIVDSIVLFVLKIVGLSEAKKNLNLVYKEKDSNFAEKDN
jgi:hypothetical protein